MSFLDNLEWRFATKKFNPESKLSSENLTKILRAIRFAPTSMGLEPFHVFVIKDSQLREKLREHSFNQPQVTDASHLLVFCTRTDISDRINDYIDLAGAGGKTSKEKLQPLKMMLEDSTKNMSAEELLNWTRRQAYLALGFGLSACAELKIDSCPMEGFVPDEVDKVLGLPKHLRSVAYLAVGYRQTGPSRNKIRFSETELFTRI